MRKGYASCVLDSSELMPNNSLLRKDRQSTPSSVPSSFKIRMHPSIIVP